MYRSATDLATAICSGVESSTNAVQNCLARIERYNPQINAIVTLSAESALKEAERIDALIRENAVVPSIAGVPITVKDAFETQGIKTTCSHPPLQNHIPEKDATVVARLKEAGAIILGKSNVPQLASDVQCWSPLFGRTNNPWNPALTSGGSSGGSAAAVAMNFSYLDMGSDLAGSIRIPAGYCGVAGLKATENRIPRTGHIPHLPQTPRSVRHLLSFGLLAGCVDDLRLGFDVIAGADGVDSEVPSLTPKLTKSLHTKPLRVAWWDDFAAIPLCTRTKTGLKNTIGKLERAGLVVERCHPKEFDFAQAWYAYGIIMGAEVGLGMSITERLPISIIKYLLPKSQILMRAFSQGMAFNWQQYNEALNIRERLIQQLAQFLSIYDVWICPVTPSTAFPHQKPNKLGKPPTIMVDDNRLSYFEGTMSMVTPFSLTGSPAVVLPVDVVDGLPVGLQIIGQRWHDEQLLDNCAAIELIIGAIQRPPNCP